VLADEHVDIVLVSPHQRALETCREIFGEKKVKVEVHPILAEVFRYSCDISNHNEAKIQNFPDYDFSFMKDHSELWFVDILSEHNKHTCKTHLSSESPLSFQDKQLKLLELMQSKVIYESPQELRARTWKIKELLR
jgi:broad specificity phosphatase PhoE